MSTLYVGIWYKKIKTQANPYATTKTFKDKESNYQDLSPK